MRQEVAYHSNDNSLSYLPHLRKCILETLRLNNPVVTTFRTLMPDQYVFPTFPTHHHPTNPQNQSKNPTYTKGDQFLILNNPVLRDPEYFTQPNSFLPNRWTPEMENSYYAIMFNQGPQKCPGKDLAIFILQSFTTHYLNHPDYNPDTKLYPQLDMKNVPQMINPCRTGA